jgi:NAD(P)-dependent dehydrogenase (short-subunit alcohol dehydrogenase family)
MDLGLSNKVALVTGAGSPVGFGRGIALTLAKAGCDIIANDIDKDGAEKTAAEIEALGRKAMAVQADVTKMAEVKEMIKKSIETFGRIDILVNNAGRATEPLPFVETPEKNWEIVFNLNIYGVFNCTKAVLPNMLERKSGKIVNISSGAGLSGMPRCVAYGASKAAIISSGINVNSIAPGLGDTNFLSTANFPEGEMEKALQFIPTGKTTTPEDVGNLAAYLASNLADNVVGQTYLIDGGMT